MTYRDELLAARARADAIATELREIDARVEELGPLLERRETLAEELARTKSAVDAARKRVPLPLLAAVRIASPCRETWSAMQGDDEVRHCARCRRDVYDLSGLTAIEAEALLQSRAGGELCVTYFQRADGTVMTEDCGAPRRRPTPANVAIVAVGAAAAASGAAYWWAHAPEDPPPRVMGALVRPGPHVPFAPPIRSSDQPIVLDDGEPDDREDLDDLDALDALDRE